MLYMKTRLINRKWVILIVIILTIIMKFVYRVFILFDSGNDKESK